MTPQTTANLLLCPIWCQGKLLIEYLETVTISGIIACCSESNCLSHHWLSYHGCTVQSSSNYVSSRMVCLMTKTFFILLYPPICTWTAEATGTESFSWCRRDVSAKVFLCNTLHRQVIFENFNKLRLLSWKAS
jgi:hypothetical protein